MSEVITKMKVHFGADTAQYRKGMNDAKKATKSLKNDAGNIFTQFANKLGINTQGISKSMSTASNSFKSLTGGLKSSAVGASFFSNAMKIVKASLVSTGIGALAVVIGTVVTAFTRFSQESDKLSVKLAGLKAVLDVFLDRIGKIGKAIIGLFEGKSLKDTAKSVKDSFKDVGDEMKNETELANELKAATIDLERRAKMFTAQRETEMTQIKSLRAYAKDTNNSDKSRYEAIKKAGQLELQLSEKSMSLADEELAASLDQIDSKTKQLKLSKEARQLIEDIKNGTIGAAEAQEKAKNLTLNDAKGKETLYELVDKIVAREQEQQRLMQTRIRIISSENTLRTEIANKNVTALNSESELKEQIADDDKLDYETRKKLLTQSVDLQKQGLKIKLKNNLINSDTYKYQIDLLYKKLRTWIEEHNEQLNKDLKKIEPINLKLDTNLETNKLSQINTKNETAIQKTINQLETAKTAANSVGSAVESSVEGAIDNIGELFGEMATGDASVSDMGTLVLTTLAELAIQVGKIAVATGVAVLGIREALQNALATPAAALAAIVAGTALIALGTAVKGALSNAVSGSSSGTSSVSSASSSSSTSSTSSTSSIRSSPIKVHVYGEFKASGKNLTTTINNYQKSKNIRGGS